MGANEMLYANIEWNKIFLRIAGTIFVLLPVMLALFIFLWNPKNTIYSFFALLNEMALISGIIIKSEDTEMHSIMTIIGLLISAIVGILFGEQYELQNGIVSFLIYLWVWLSLYRAGLEISLEYVEYEKLLNSLIISIGSIATLSSYWFSFFF